MAYEGETKLETADIVVLVAYFVILIFFGLWVSLRNKSLISGGIWKQDFPSSIAAAMLATDHHSRAKSINHSNLSTVNNKWK